MWHPVDEKDSKAAMRRHRCSLSPRHWHGSSKFFAQGHRRKKWLSVPCCSSSTSAGSGRRSCMWLAPSDRSSKCGCRLGRRCRWDPDRLGILIFDASAKLRTGFGFRLSGKRVSRSRRSKHGIAVFIDLRLRLFGRFEPQSLRNIPKSNTNCRGVTQLGPSSPATSPNVGESIATCCCS